jgi:hypothetical protein
MEPRMSGKKLLSRALDAMYDKDRKGIFVHRDRFKDLPFDVGDRFSIHKGRQELFTLKIRKDPLGDLVMDRNGLFIPRSRRVDILLGGIYDEFILESDPRQPDGFQLRPATENSQ